VDRIHQKRKSDQSQKHEHGIRYISIGLGIEELRPFGNLIGSQFKQKNKSACNRAANYAVVYARQNIYNVFLIFIVLQANTFVSFGLFAPIIKHKNPFVDIF
jgi:hypothetical protein